MTEISQSRREALRRTAFAAGALAVGGLLRPALALAQSTQDEDLRDFLVPAIGLEQITVLAYGKASEQANADDRELLEELRDQEQAHASALRSALDSLGLDAPDAPNSPDDTGVFDDIEGLADDTATEYKDLLGQIGDATDTDSFLELLSDLEKRQVTYYVEETPDVDSFDLATTAAEIAGCQAAHIVVVRELLGDSPEDAASVAADAIGSGKSG